MTRKDYRALATVIRAARVASEDPRSVDMIARALCATFSVDNPAFDRAQWLAACGTPTE